MGVFLSIGSNLGDKEKNCRKSIDYLENTEGIDLVKISGFYKTAPVDYTDQDWFINCAVELKTDLAPEKLLETIQSIENKMGRKRDIRFGPRTIDLDIIFYDDMIINSDKLEIPHPRMQERLFVLEPLCDLDKDFVHPVLNCDFPSLKDKLIKENDISDQEIEKI